MSALYQYVCALIKCQHFIEIFWHYWNVGVLLKCWHFLNMLAHYWNVGALLKCRCFIKMLAHYWNVGTLLKCRCFIKMVAHYWNVGPTCNKSCKNYNSCTGWTSPYCLAWQNSKVTTPPLLMLVALSFLLKVYSRPFLVQLLSASLFGWTTPVPARHGRTSQMFAFYSNVSALLKCRHCSTTGKPTHLFRTKCASLDSV